MWAIARVDLRMSRPEFGRLTPREYHALIQRLEEAERKWFTHDGVLASVIANVNRSQDTPAYSPLDFVPKHYHRSVQGPRQTLAEQVSVLTAIFGCGPNKPNQTESAG